MLLCPGYKQIDMFGLTTTMKTKKRFNLDLGSVDPSLLRSPASFGLDTPSPSLQLSGGTVLNGDTNTCWEPANWCLLMAKTDASVDRSKRTVAYLASTKQRVCFEEVRLQPEGQKEPKTEDNGRRAGSGGPGSRLTRKSNRKGKKSSNGSMYNMKTTMVGSARAASLEVYIFIFSWGDARQAEPQRLRKWSPFLLVRATVTRQRLSSKFYYQQWCDVHLEIHSGIPVGMIDSERKLDKEGIYWSFLLIQLSEGNKRAEYR
ncbi:hypothetical protein IW261DRAFT_1420235 [Armillaria novae-zelandiae]|uniref:Uncharacterized protein n=1 Tax=Armillaria novae-zelandiae TaxID=153914 RepID=A0AA39UHC6_9AGAR|nr:hypothetical protein IW261DRAFT_1420235 [Armillaria novae-zelandiae]